MIRSVMPEMLDELIASDPRAVRSRLDLRRVHQAMRTRAILTRALRDLQISKQAGAPLRVLELGAGDGSLMLAVASGLAGSWPKVALTLLDRQKLLDRSTATGYLKLGWTATSWVMDVHQWAVAMIEHHYSARPLPRWDLIVANLFLHHFEGAQLSNLLAAISMMSERFVACEPRRSRISLIASHLVGAIGVNSVTRKDAVLSVHAGFRGGEIAESWPAPTLAWQSREYAAGLFSHCFVAMRTGAP